MLTPPFTIGRRGSLFLAAGALLPILVSLYAANAMKRSQQALMADLQTHVRLGSQYDALGIGLAELENRTLVALSSGSLAELRSLRTTDARFAAAIAEVRRAAEASENGPERPEALQQLDRIEASRARIAAASARAVQALARDPLAGAAAELPVVHGAGRAGFVAIAAARRSRRVALVGQLERVRVQSERLTWLQHALFALFLVTTVAVALRARRAFRERLYEQERQQRVEALQRRNEVLEEALAGIAAFGAEQRFTWVNSTFAEITGYGAQELIGMPVAALFAREDLHVMETVEAELRRNGRIEQELRGRRKDGTFAHVQVVLVARGGGECFAFVKDVTAEKQAVASLREMNERFTLAMRATRDVFFDWDLKANRGWLSDAIHTEFGYPRSSDPNEWWLQSIHPEDRERVVATLAAALADGPDVVTDEYRIGRYDGTYAPVYHRLYIVRDENGEACRLVGATTDVSERRKVLDEVERLSTQNRMILAAAGDGIIGVDNEGRTTFANPSATAFLGWSAEELLGKALSEIVLTDAGGDAHPHGVPARGKATFLRKDGSTIPVELTSQPMTDPGGAVAGAVVTFRDITERVAVERMKDEFISIVSHELRTPLTSIRGALGLVAGGRAGAVPETMSRMLDIAVSNTDRLVRLINDILDIERMESGMITLLRRLCPAGALIEDAIEPMRMLAAQAEVRLERGPAEGVLFADRDRLLQTLTNLIGNAIKFSPPGALVRVSAWTEANHVGFSVEDQGRGIPRDKLQTIFERFQQVDASDSREKGGSGLGLAICRSIVRQHGGEIRAESDGSSGSRFVFTLPREDAADLAGVMMAEVSRVA